MVHFFIRKPEGAGSERFMKIQFLKPSGKVLDVGAEYALLKDYLPGCEYYGIDIDPKKEFILKCDVSVDRLPFEDGSFDYVFLMEILEHLQNPSHCLRECKRVLKPGGKIVGTVPNVYNWQYLLRAFLGKWYDKSYHLHNYERITLGNLFKISGLTASIVPYWLKVPKCKNLAFRSLGCFDVFSWYWFFVCS